MQHNCWYTLILYWMKLRIGVYCYSVQIRLVAIMRRCVSRSACTRKLVLTCAFVTFGWQRVSYSMHWLHTGHLLSLMCCSHTTLSRGKDNLVPRLLQNYNKMIKNLIFVVLFSFFGFFLFFSGEKHPNELFVYTKIIEFNLNTSRFRKKLRKFYFLNFSFFLVRSTLMNCLFAMILRPNCPNLFVLHLFDLLCIKYIQIPALRRIRI